MANPPAGSKRPHEGPEQRSERDKRQRSDARDRERDAKERDRRDTRRRSPDRERERSMTGRDHDRERDRHTHSRERRDDRDRDRRVDRDRRRDHDRDRERDRDRRPSRREEDRRRTPNGRQPPPPQPRKAPESDREEGEISPHLSREHTPVSLAKSSTASAVPSSTLPAPVPEQEELELSTSPVPIEQTLAARRAKRAEILAKYTGIASANSAASGASSTTVPVLLPVASAVITNGSTASKPSPLPPQIASLPGVANRVPSRTQDEREEVSVSPTDGVFELAKAQSEERGTGHAPDEQMISAADYDPGLDQREDEKRRVNAVVEEEIEEMEEDDDDDLDDMFATGLTEKKKKKTVRKVKKVVVPALITTTLDAAADAEGYYQTILGEQLDGGRYQVFALLGKGMFANVVRARVLQSEEGDVGREVAIKIIRSQESMHKAGQKELQILNKLRQADPEDKKHVVRLERSFEHRGHLCLVFESLSMNLRDVVKKFGKDVGLNIRAVRAYAHQLFLAMSLLRKCNIMHADIKPDNILVNEQKTLLKLCDLGSASDASENDITPYLVSRFYRAPEIILGYPYDPALDIWSIGCTLYELYTGKILLPGRSNNQMLLLMMELRGRFNAKMIKKAKFGSDYFDEMGAFASVERDRVTGADVIRNVSITKPARDLRARLLPPASAQTQMKDDERKLLISFVDLLDRCLTLDPAKRITPKEALSHSFIRG